MFDTTYLSKLRLALGLVMMASVSASLFFSLSGDAYVAESAFVVQSAPSYDVCLQDDSNGSRLLFNSTTGDYIFVCGGCFKKTGKGSLVKSGCIIALQQGSSETDRSITARIDTCSKKATASLQSPPGQTQRSITDNNTSDSQCSD